MRPTPWKKTTGVNNLAEQLQNSTFSWPQNKTEHHSRTNSSSLQYSSYSRDAEKEANSFWTFHRVQSLGSANETYVGLNPTGMIGHGEKKERKANGQHLSKFSGNNNGKQVPSSHRPAAADMADPVIFHTAQTAPPAVKSSAPQLEQAKNAPSLNMVTNKKSSLFPTTRLRSRLRTDRPRKVARPPVPNHHERPSRNFLQTSTAPNRSPPNSPIIGLFQSAESANSKATRPPIGPQKEVSRLPSRQALPRPSGGSLGTFQPAAAAFRRWPLGLPVRTVGPPGRTLGLALVDADPVLVLGLPLALGNYIMDTITGTGGQRSVVILIKSRMCVKDGGANRGG
jgi:hypothetical protein